MRQFGLDSLSYEVWRLTSSSISAPLIMRTSFNTWLVPLPPSAERTYFGVLRDEDVIFAIFYGLHDPLSHRYNGVGDWYRVKNLGLKGVDWIVSEIKRFGLREYGAAEFNSIWSQVEAVIHAKSVWWCCPWCHVVNADEAWSTQTAGGFAAYIQGFKMRFRSRYRKIALMQKSSSISQLKHNLVNSKTFPMWPFHSGFAAFWIRANIYVRAQYVNEHLNLGKARKEAYAAGLLGKNAYGSVYGFDVLSTTVLVPTSVVKGCHLLQKVLKASKRNQDWSTFFQLMLGCMDDARLLSL